VVGPARLDRTTAGRVSAGQAAAMALQNLNERSEKLNATVDATENLKNSTTNMESRLVKIRFFHLYRLIIVSVFYDTCSIEESIMQRTRARIVVRVERLSCSSPGWSLMGRSVSMSRPYTVFIDTSGCDRTN
ncbi:hypothetical protein PENTCL1PPCAC_11022, partial [Pristionchus entomophagus]